MAIFTDGCTAQLKNRFIFSALPQLQFKHGYSVTWSFFAISHGKGAVYGVGATVKRGVRNAVKSRQVQITTAEDLAKFSANITKNIKIFYIDKEKVNERRISQSERWSKIKKIPNLLSKHHFEVGNGHFIFVTSVSGSKSIQNHKIL